MLQGRGPATPPVLTDAGLRGAVVIVTGGGSGIGAATARQLGSVDAPVVLAGRREGPLNEVAAQITAAGGEALCVLADLADPDSPRRITDACLARYGRIDGLVNNAAVVRHMPLAEWDTGCFDEHVATNIRAPFFLSQAARPALRESPVRSVVNIGSSSGTLRRVG
ncbi:MAG: SDR family NAD(P)-dependent oxidoreductase, partial [Streptosporangiaceae bacterium]